MIPAGTVALAEFWRADNVDIKREDIERNQIEDNVTTGNTAKQLCIVIA
jgi:hypothetical protein